jgi:hypothetical protein
MKFLQTLAPIAQGVNQGISTLANFEQLQNAQQTNAINKMKINEMQRQESELNKPMDIKSHPTFMGMPEDSKKIVFEYGRSLGALDDQGFTTKRGLDSIFKGIESSNELFEASMKPVLNKQFTTMQNSYAALQQAVEDNSPDAEVYQQKYLQDKGVYDDAFSKFYEHTNAIKNKEAEQAMKVFQAKEQYKEGLRRGRPSSGGKLTEKQRLYQSYKAGGGELDYFNWDQKFYRKGRPDRRDIIPIRPKNPKVPVVEKQKGSAVERLRIKF